MQQLHNADCLKFLPTLPANSIDMVLTDPPYSSGGLHIGSRRQGVTTKYAFGDGPNSHDFAHDNKDQRSWRNWCVEWLGECHRVMKDGAVIAVFIDWRQLPTMTDALQMAGFIWHGIAVWDKGSAGCRPRKGGMKQQAEFIVWGSKGKLRQDLDVYPGGVFGVRRDRSSWHVTSKPVSMLEDIMVLAGPDGVVFDPFAGGGSTLLAARNTGRPAIGCEVVASIYQKAHADIAALPPVAA